MVAEQRKLLEQTKEDAGRLGEKNAVKDDYYLQVKLVFRLFFNLDKLTSSRCGNREGGVIA